MANGNGNDGHWWDNAWENLPSEWGETESRLYEELISETGESALADDRIFQALYDEAMFNFDLSHQDRVDILDTMRDYAWDEYGIDFDDVFDWEAYREAYDSVA